MASSGTCEFDSERLTLGTQHRYEILKEGRMALTDGLGRCLMIFVSPKIHLESFQTREGGCFMNVPGKLSLGGRDIAGP